MRLCSLLLAAGVLTCIPIQGDGARILGFFYFQARSHFVIFERLMKGLAERGHDVVVVSHFPQQSKVANYTDISVKGSSRSIMNSFSVDTVRNFNIINFFYFQWKENIQFCKDVLDHPDVQNLINSNEKFDLIITGLFGLDCWPGFAYKFKVPVIAMVSSVASPWANSRLGNPDNPSYIPNFFTSFRPEMNFKQRLMNTMLWLYTTWGQYYYAELSMDKVLQKYFGEDMPPSSVFIKNTSLVFINSHFSINQARPAVPAFVEVGGLHITPPKKLPQDLEKYISEAPHGVIYFSLGSLINGSSLPEDKIQLFTDAFREIPQHILWKIDPKVVKNIPANVKTSTWLPQIDVLNHPNVRTFISHGGLHSSEESVYTGVPIVGMGMFFDQQQNIEGLADLGVAYKLDYDTLSKESILTGIKAVLEDPSYRNNMQRLSKLFRDRPQTALETAIYWTEYIIRYKGAPHLRSTAVDLPLYQYLLLDVIAVLLLAVVTIALVVLFIVKKIITTITSFLQREKEKSN